MTTTRTPVGVRVCYRGLLLWVPAMGDSWRTVCDVRGCYAYPDGTDGPYVFCAAHLAQLDGGVPARWWARAVAWVRARVGRA